MAVLPAPDNHGCYHLTDCMIGFIPREYMESEGYPKPYIAMPDDVLTSELRDKKYYHDTPQAALSWLKSQGYAQAS